MAFMYQLRQLRQEHNLSQQALADAIFVSRSAIAKWENGLGLPSEIYYDALLRFFDIPNTALSITADDLLMMNRKYRRGGSILFACSIPFLSCGLFWTYVAFIMRQPPYLGSIAVDQLNELQLLIILTKHFLHSHSTIDTCLIIGLCFLVGILLMCCSIVMFRKCRREDCR